MQIGQQLEAYSEFIGQTQSSGRDARSAWQLLCELLPAVDLTSAAQAGELDDEIVTRRQLKRPDLGRGDPCEMISRGLYRHTRRHVFVTGLKGVGKTTLVRELAYRANCGDIPVLRERHFLWLDCSNIGPEDSRACLETTLLAASAWPHTVLCIDGLTCLLQRAAGGSNKPLLRAAASRRGLQIIGIVSNWEFADVIGRDAGLMELFSRVELEEPDDETALSIARHAARRLEADFGLTIDERVVRRAVSLSSSFILNERQPAKAMKILRHVCEDADFDRTQLGREQKGVTTADVVRVVAEVTGIPKETLSGEGENADFREALKARVVGQPAAVDAVANELELIKAGLNEPGKPASVLLFAGMTGVGKTELAKRLAELYSASKRLQTYAMGNFTEPHSVSGIIGVPPGYVGHDHGGRLINELNADPYSVFLLDEAEKAHPNVWKPFLNLFDEGWIEDQRGVRAYADRAIFILTTNAGDQHVAQMTDSAKSSEEIAQRVKEILAKIKHERSSQPVFTPQFLSRLRQVIVFGPLDLQAMIGITQAKIAHIQEQWWYKREKLVKVPNEYCIELGRRAHEFNHTAKGKEGGRIVRKIITDSLEMKIQSEAQKRPIEYRDCTQIEVQWSSAMESATI